MSRNITTATKIALGAGHVIEDKYPLPIAMRKTKSKPPVNDPGSAKDVPSESNKNIKE